LRIVRFKADDRPRYGLLGGNSVHSLKVSPFAQRASIGYQPALAGDRYRLDEVKLLAPCTPSKVICLGVNYRKPCR